MAKEATVVEKDDADMRGEDGVKEKEVGAGVNIGVDDATEDEEAAMDSACCSNRPSSINLSI